MTLCIYEFFKNTNTSRNTFKFFEKDDCGAQTN